VVFAFRRKRIVGAKKEKRRRKKRRYFKGLKGFVGVAFHFFFDKGRNFSAVRRLGVKKRKKTDLNFYLLGFTEWGHFFIFSFFDSYSPILRKKAIGFYDRLFGFDFLFAEEVSS
jgi:hypothetical protein